MLNGVRRAKNKQKKGRVMQMVVHTHTHTHTHTQSNLIKKKENILTDVYILIANVGII